MPPFNYKLCLPFALTWPESPVFDVSRSLYDKRISQEVLGEDLGEEFAGYVSIYFLSSK
jgi:hypothetical protein